MSEVTTYDSTAAEVTNPFGEITQQQLDELAYFQQRFKEERQKRLRPDGLAQYSNVSTTEKLKKFWEDPWVTAGTPIHEPVSDGGSIKLMILGAGAAGILQAVQCIKAGMSAEEILFVDVAAGYGGAWYWNRYPGAACDTESYCYMPMLEEMNYMPSKKYAPGWEFRRHYERIASRYHLQDRAMWQTWSQTANWDADAKQWDVALLQKPKGGAEKSLTIHAKYIVIAAGLQSVPKMPNLEGFDKYAGRLFLASRWDYDYTGGSPEDQQLWNLTRKKVALIGNAASGGQAIVELAKYAQDVYMFQRTPVRVVSKPNPLTHPIEWEKIAYKPGWQAERNKHLNAFATYDPKRPDNDYLQDTHSRLLGFCANLGTPRDIKPEEIPAWVQHLNVVDIPVLKSVHTTVDKTIEDPALAEKVKAWFPTWCKRSLFSDDYLPTLNRPNVHVIDTNGKGVDRLTEKGVFAAGEEYTVDVIIFATGFESPFGSPDAKVGMKITGVAGLAMKTKWDSEAGMGTLHGVISRGFPNIFWHGPSQSTISAAATYGLERMSEHVAHLITTSSKKSVSIHPTEAAEADWGNRIASMKNCFAAAVGCTPSLSNGEGAMEFLKDKLSPEKKAAMAKLGLWGRGVEDYLNVLREWRLKDDLESEFELL